MTQYIITGEPIGSRAQVPPFNVIAWNQASVGQQVALTLSAQDEATLIAGGILQLYPGAGAYRGAWQPNWRYDANDVVLFAGSLYEANAAFTSGASFNATNWTLLSGSGGAPLIENVETISASGAAVTLADVAADTLHLVTLTAAVVAFTFPTAAAGKSFTAALKQDATGGRTATWPGTVKWSGGTAPTLTTTAAKTDVLAFVCFDGTNWLGFVSGLNF